MKKIIIGLSVSLLIMVGLFLPGFFVKKDQIVMGGSTSIYPLFHKIDHLAKQKKINYLYNSQGSSAARTNVLNGNFLLGFISKEPSQETLEEIKKKNLKKFLLARDAIVFIYALPQECHLKDSRQQQLNFSLTELKKIFFAKTAYWEELEDVVCSTSKKIIRINRENGSGTRTIFEKKILGLDVKKNRYQKYYDERNEKSSGVILRAFKNGKIAQGSLSYISFFYQQEIIDLHKKNKKIHYAKINHQDVKASQYFFYRNFYGLFLAKNSDRLTIFFNFLTKEVIREKIIKMGFNYQFNFPH